MPTKIPVPQQTQKIISAYNAPAAKKKRTIFAVPNPPVKLKQQTVSWPETYKASQNLAADKIHNFKHMR